MDLVADVRTDPRSLRQLVQILCFWIAVEIDGHQRNRIDLLFHAPWDTADECLHIERCGQLTLYELNFVLGHFTESADNIPLFLLVDGAVGFRGIDHRPDQQLGLLFGLTIIHPSRHRVPGIGPNPLHIALICRAELVHRHTQQVAQSTTGPLRTAAEKSTEEVTNAAATGARLPTTQHTADQTAQITTARLRPASRTLHRLRSRPR